MKKYKEEIIFAGFLLIVILAWFLIQPVSNMDELWNFNYARNFANGLLPYKDFNMISTPGVAFFFGIILKLFGTELITMRISAVILNTILFFIIYKILKLLKIDKYISMLVTILLFGLLSNYIFINYNLINLFISIILLYIELKIYAKSENIFDYKFKRDFGLGIIAGISILFKHTTGLVFTVIFIGYKVLAIRKKNEIKQFLKIAISRLLGSIIPIICLIIYLQINGLIMDFINYAILGIFEFSNSRSYLNLLFSDFQILALLVPIIFLVLLYQTIKNNKTMIILFAFSIANFIGIYPIADESHFLISGLIVFIAGIYLLNNIIKDIFKSFSKITYKILKILTIALILIFFVVAIYLIIYFIINISGNIEFENFKHINISKSDYQIKEIDEYIEEQESEVYILDVRAALYMISLNRYNKNYDMLLKGNLGEDGSEKLIANLESKENVKLLILTNLDNLNWQIPMDVIQYVLDTYTKTDEIGIFSIYEKE